MEVTWSRRNLRTQIVLPGKTGSKAVITRKPEYGLFEAPGYSAHSIREEPLCALICVCAFPPGRVIRDRQAAGKGRFHEIVKSFLSTFAPR